MPQRCLEEIDSEIKEVHGRTFRKLGSLLIEIVDRKLFQLKGFTNVEDYFNSEPHLPSARQAFRLISATRFSRHLPRSLPQPKSERQVRPLLGRPIEEAKLLWGITTRIAAERKVAVDGKLVSKVVKEYQEGKLDAYVLRVEASLKAAAAAESQLQPTVRDPCHAQQGQDSPAGYLVVENEGCVTAATKESPKAKAYKRQVVHGGGAKRERRPGCILGIPSVPSARPKTQVKGQNSQAPLALAPGCVRPPGRAHSAPSQASSSDNVCSGCNASSDCQILSMTQQIAGIVGVLSQAWGCCSDGSQQCAPVQQPSSSSRLASDNPLIKSSAFQVACEDLQTSPNYGKKHKHSDRKEAVHGRDQCNVDHTSEVAMVLRKSHQQLLSIMQRFGMTPEQNHTACAWNFWPQPWTTHPDTMPDWRQWRSLPDAAAHVNKGTMHMYTGNYGTLVPSTLYRAAAVSSTPVAAAAPSLYEMQTIAEADDRGYPLIPVDGLQYACAATTANGPYSHEQDTILLEAKSMMHEAPVPYSLALPLPGKKRGRSPDGARATRASSARRGKMVRFATPGKMCGLVEAKDEMDAQKETPSRRVDEIMVAEVLVCMSRCLEDHTPIC